MSEAPGPINFTMFLTMFGEKLNGTDPEDVIRNAFACFDEEASGQYRGGMGGCFPNNTGLCKGIDHSRRSTRTTQSRIDSTAYRVLALYMDSPSLIP